MARNTAAATGSRCLTRAGTRTLGSSDRQAARRRSYGFRADGDEHGRQQEEADGNQVDEVAWPGAELDQGTGGDGADGEAEHDVWLEATEANQVGLAGAASTM